MCVCLPRNWLTRGSRVSSEYFVTGSHALSVTIEPRIDETHDLARPAKLAGRAKSWVSSILGSMVTDKAWEPVTKYSLDTRDPRVSQFLGKQKHVVTEHYGELVPLDIDDYIKKDGFKALKEVLAQDRESVVEGKDEV